jgi:hypothetical protein
MPHLFRTLDSKIWKPSQPVPLWLADGTKVEGIWAGSATEEKFAWWLRDAGNQLTQSEPVAAVASKADDDGEIIWGEAPTGARLLFVLEASPPGKNYRLAKMVTTAAKAAQIAYFRHDRAPLFGTLKLDGSIQRIPPLNPQPPPDSYQPKLL